MSILKSNSFVPFKNIKLNCNLNNDNLTEKVENIMEKKYKNSEFKYLYDKYFLQKQDTVLNIIEELREFDLHNGTDIFKNVLYLNLYDLLYK
jgi:hypothetical protein